MDLQAGSSALTKSVFSSPKNWPCIRDDLTSETKTKQTCPSWYLIRSLAIITDWFGASMKMLSLCSGSPTNRSISFSCMQLCNYTSKKGESGRGRYVLEVQASPLTVTVLGRQKKCHCKRVSLYPTIFSRRRFVYAPKNCHCSQSVTLTGVTVSGVACIHKSVSFAVTWFYPSQKDDLFHLSSNIPQPLCNCKFCKRN